jgi:hypothetical protein
MDSLVALRFKINELKMLDFLEKRKETNAYFGCRSLQNLRN